MPRLLKRNINSSILNASVNPSISIADSASLKPSGSAISIELWIKPELRRSNDYQVIVAKFADATWANGGYGLYTNQYGSLKFFINHYVTGATTTINGKLNNNVWQHIVAVYNGVDLRIYINGVLSNTPTSYSTPINYTNGYVGIGMHYGSQAHTSYFSDIKIYSRELSATDVYNRYWYGTDNSSMRQGLILELLASNTSGTTITDTSGNSNNATLNSSSQFNTDSPMRISTINRHVGGSVIVGAPSSTSYAVAAANPSLSFGSDSGSIRFCARIGSFANATHVMARYCGATYNIDGWMLNQFGNDLRVYIKSGSPGLTITNLFKDFGWHLYHAVFDASDHSVTIYVDGAFVAKSATNAWSGAFNANEALYIGGYTGGSIGGAVSDVVYAVGTVWNASDIFNEYLFNKQLPGITHSWKLDEGYGTTAYPANGAVNMTLTSSSFSADSPIKLRNSYQNLLPNSDNCITNWTQTRLTGTDTQSDPFGGTGATLWTETSDGSPVQHYFAISVPTTLANENYIFSIFAKANTRNFILLSADNGSCTVAFNLSTLAKTVNISTNLISYNCVDYGNGWVRCWVIAKRASPTNLVVCWIGNTTANTYTGNGSSPIYTYGSQLEVLKPGQTEPSLYLSNNNYPLVNYGVIETNGKTLSTNRLLL